MEADNLSYQWIIANSSTGKYENIEGATNKTLVLIEDYKDKFIKVIIKGNNNSSKTSNSTMKIEANEENKRPNIQTTDGKLDVNGDTIILSFDKSLENKTGSDSSESKAQQSLLVKDSQGKQLTLNDFEVKITNQNKEIHVKVKKSGFNDKVKISLKNNVGIKSIDGEYANDFTELETREAVRTSVNVGIGSTPIKHTAKGSNLEQKQIKSLNLDNNIENINLSNIGQNSTMNVRIFAKNMNEGKEIILTVNLDEEDNIKAIASKIRVKLGEQDKINSFFNIKGSDSLITLEAKEAAEDDLNLSLRLIQSENIDIKERIIKNTIYASDSPSQKGSIKVKEKIGKTVTKALNTGDIEVTVTRGTDKEDNIENVETIRVSIDKNDTDIDVARKIVRGLQELDESSNFRKQYKASVGTDYSNKENVVVIESLEYAPHSHIDFKIKASITKVSSADIKGVSKINNTIMAIANDGATDLSYQWKVSDTKDGVYQDILGENKSTLTLKEDYLNKFIKVIIKGYSDSNATSEALKIGASDAIIVVEEAIIEGIAEVGETLEAKTNDGATNLKYQWKISDTEQGTYENIVGAIESTLILNKVHKDKFIKVTISGDESSNRTSNATSKVIEKINNAAKVQPIDGKFEANEDTVKIVFNKSLTNKENSVSKTKNALVIKDSNNNQLDLNDFDLKFENENKEIHLIIKKAGFNDKVKISLTNNISIKDVEDNLISDFVEIESNKIVRTDVGVSIGSSNTINGNDKEEKQVITLDLNDKQSNINMKNVEDNTTIKVRVGSTSMIPKEKILDVSIKSEDNINAIADKIKGDISKDKDIIKFFDITGDNGKVILTNKEYLYDSNMGIRILPDAKEPKVIEKAVWGSITTQGSSKIKHMLSSEITKPLNDGQVKIKVTEAGETLAEVTINVLVTDTVTNVADKIVNALKEKNEVTNKYNVTRGSGKWDNKENRVILEQVEGTESKVELKLSIVK